MVLYRMSLSSRYSRVTIAEKIDKTWFDPSGHNFAISLEGDRFADQISFDNESVRDEMLKRIKIALVDDSEIIVL